MPRRSRRKGRSHIQRPFVAATFAITADGKITTRTFSPVDFTSREDKAHLIRQRALADAVLIGHTTLARDNVRLGIPRVELRDERLSRKQSAYPMRVIITNSGRIDPKLNIFQTDFAPIVIFSTTRMPRKTQKVLREKATLHLSKTGVVDLTSMLQQLRHDYGVRTVACEGGATLFRSMLELGLIDQLNLTIAPFIFGGADAPTLTGRSKTFLPKSIGAKLTAMKVIGEECFLTYRIGRPRSSRAKPRDPVA